jgi:hypothetical protein
MKINEIITENDELYEWVPAVIGRVATALAPKIKTAWNAIKGTTKSTTKSNKDLISKSDDMYGLTRTFPGGVARHHLAKGPKTKNVVAKTKTKTKTKTKSKHTGSKDGNVNYSAGGRYTQGIPKSKYNPKPK